MTNRYVDYLPIDTIRGAHRNPKGHATEAITRSIDHFGLAELPLLDERTGRLVAGHGRHHQLLAMHTAGNQPPDGIRVDDTGTWLMPVIRGWASRSDNDAEAYLIASNHITTLGGWEDHGLAEILEELQDADLLELTGFEDDDLAQLPDTEPGEPGTHEPPPNPVTHPGDVWLLGPHRLICGDSRDHTTVTTVLDGARINLAFTSPPYASQRTYDDTSGFQPIPPDEYVDWFDDVQANIRAHLADDGSWFLNIKAHCDDGQRHLYVHDLVLAHVRRWAWRFTDELCWVDTHNGVPGSWPNRFKDAWEPVFHFTTSKTIRFNPLANATETDRAFAYSPNRRSPTTGSGLLSGAHTDEQPGIARPSNVLQIPAASGEAGGLHSAPFPVKLPAWFIRAYTDPSDTVFDPFMGSGTTLIAAHNENRVAYGVEISPGYCDVICRRYQEHTGTTPILEATGQPHDFTSDKD